MQSLGDEKWWEVFQDPDLQNLVRTALKNNYDVRIAATRVLQAQAQLGITRADQFPTVTGGGNIASIQNPQIGPIPSYELTQGALLATASWNPDFWGTLSPGDRVGPRQLARQRVGAEGSHLHPGRECCC